MKIIRGLKQGSIVSPVLFSISTSFVTKGINGGLIIDSCDLSLLCYADDILRISSNISTLQCNLDQLTRGYDCLSVRVNAKKIWSLFLVHDYAYKILPGFAHATSYVVVGGAKVFPQKLVKCLGITCRCSITSTRTLLVENVSKAIRFSYAKLASVKYTFNRKVLSRLYSAVSQPHLLHITPLWEWQSAAEN